MYEIATSSILTPQNGMNIYRGRTENTMWVNEIPRADSMDIGVKKDAEEILNITLKKRRSKSMLIAGNLGDPYNRLEEEFKLTKGALSVTLQNDFGINITTRSKLILRDLDLLSDLVKYTKCCVDVPFPAASQEIFDGMEGQGAFANPEIPSIQSSFQERLDMMAGLRAAGVPVCILMQPIIPELNDKIEEIQGIMKLGKELGIGAFDIGPCKTLLKKNSMDFFYNNYAERFPEQYKTLEEKYGQSQELIPAEQKELLKAVRELGEKYGLETDSHVLSEYRRHYTNQQTGSQASLLDFM